MSPLFIKGLPIVVQRLSTGTKSKRGGGAGACPSSPADESEPFEYL